MDKFSRNYFKKNKLFSVLFLAYDKVQNVRRKVAENLCKIKLHILETDKENLKKYEDAYKYLIGDKNKEIKYLAIDSKD